LASADPGATPVSDPASPATPAAPKKLAEPARPRPAADADANKPAAKAKPRAADTTPAPRADDAPDSGGPLSITPQGHHRRTVVASADPAASPREAAPAQPNAVHGDSGFSIQLAASPSETDARATLSRLQHQFPGLLGGGSVRRANLGSKGVFYRVRVGPLSRDAADKICSQVKAGGAACILTRG
jgi:cell division septation protein DedD